MGLFNKKRFKRDEVVKAIIELESKINILETKIDQNDNERNILLQKGSDTTDRNKRLMIAKKISFIDEDKQESIKQVMILLYNLNLSKKLKNAIESNEFSTKIDSSQIYKMLSDQKKLAKFLNKALNRRIKVEDMLTDTDELFKQVNENYQPNESIFGINQNDDELLSIFEQQDLHKIESKENDKDFVIEKNKNY